MCGFCVPRFDHHCVWINACVGEHNYKYFVLFLIFHMIWTTYGFVLSILAFMNVIEQNKLTESVFVDQSGNTYKGDYMIIAQYLLEAQTPMMFGGLIYAVCSVLLILFTAYHLYLIWGNTTTAETMKFS